jgi:cytochrome c553
MVMMVRDQCPFKLANPWPQIGWWAAISMVAVSVILGFLVLSRLQQNGPELGMWTAICTALGITADSGPAGEPQPPLRTPTRLAWTEATREAIASGDAEHGAFVALNCGACHGEQGVSQSSLIPTLAGMDAAVIYKQLDDYQSRKRLWGVMNGIVMALTLQDRSDVAAYLASRTGGMPPVRSEGAPAAGRSLRQPDPALRLIFAGDPKRGTTNSGESDSSRTAGTFPTSLGLIADALISTRTSPLRRAGRSISTSDKTEGGPYYGFLLHTSGQANS